MKDKVFISNILIMTASALITRAIGIFLTAYMSRKIGVEGIGLIHLIYSAYAMASTLATSGMILVVSRLVAEETAKHNDGSVSLVVGRCVALSIVVSLCVGGLLYFYAGFIGQSLLNEVRAVQSLKLIALSLPFMAISSCLRGYFLGIRKAVKTAGASLFEQTVRVFITMLILDFFLPKGLEYACIAVVLGSVGAEVIACLYAYVLYIFERTKSSQSLITTRRTVASKRGLLRIILGIAAPIAASSYLRTGLRTSENLLIPSGLRKSGLSDNAALSQYGVVTGMVMPTLMLPAALLMSVSMLIVPEVARANAGHQFRRVYFFSDHAFHLTLLMSILIAGLFAFFPGELCLVIYQSREAGNILRILAVLVPFMYLDHIVDGILNGLNQQMKSLKYNIADSLLRIGMICLLIPHWGMMGYIVAIFASTLFNSSLSIRCLLKVTGLKVPVVDWIMKPLLCTVLAGSVVKLLFQLAAPDLASAGSFVVEEMVLTGFLYVGLLWVSQSIAKEEIQWARSLFKASRRT